MNKFYKKVNQVPSPSDTISTATSSSNIIDMSEFYEYKWTSGHDKKSFDSTSIYSNNECIKNKQQYNRNEPSDRNRALIALKELIGASIDLAMKDKSCGQDDEFLNRFLFAKKFNVDEAFKLIIRYHEYKQRNIEILQKMSALDEHIQMALRDGFPAVIPQRDRRGRKVIVFFTSNWNPNAYSLVTVFRSMLLSLEKLLEDKQNQANGFVAIVDWTNFTMRQSTHLNPKILKLMIEGLQDCFPIRFKAIHFVGQPWYVEAALAVIRPFLKEKTRERIILHGSNLSTLHECIAKDILPTELGGEGPSVNPLDWVHTLLECSQIIEKQQTYRLTQCTIYSKPPQDYIRNTTCLLQQEEFHLSSS